MPQGWVEGGGQGGGRNRCTRGVRTGPHLFLSHCLVKPEEGLSGGALG